MVETTLPERLWRCDCGCCVLGVSFYEWREDPPDWFIEIYRMPGIGSWRWRLKNAFNMLAGRDVTIDCAALDKAKTEELIAFLQESIAQAEEAARG